MHPFFLDVHEETIVMRPSKPAAGVVQARALHFIREGRSLIISYFEHGILCVILFTVSPVLSQPWSAVVGTLSMTSAIGICLPTSSACS